MTAHIQIVGYNHRAHLAACVRSCLQQSRRVPVLYVDNASADGSVDFVRREFPDVRVRANPANRGYSGGHNDGLKEIPDTDLVVVLNPDVELAPDFVERSVASVADARVGAVVPLLLRPDRKTVDAYGTRLLPSLRAVNQLEGEPLSRIPDSGFQIPSWGFTGACALLRRAALNDCAINGEIFDEDLFAYREDVDLSWRLKNRGWRIVGDPLLRATHARAVRAGAPKDPRVARLSWRNYYLVLAKSVPARVLLRHAPAVFAEDLARAFQLLVTPSLWPALPELFRLLPRAAAKRRQATGGGRG